MFEKVCVLLLWNNVWGNIYVIIGDGKIMFEELVVFIVKWKEMKDKDLEF